MVPATVIDTFRIGFFGGIGEIPRGSMLGNALFSLAYLPDDRFSGIVCNEIMFIFSGLCPKYCVIHAESFQ
jgi:hypothetical protein